MIKVDSNEEIEVVTQNNVTKLVESPPHKSSLERPAEVIKNDREISQQKKGFTGKSTFATEKSPSYVESWRRLSAKSPRINAMDRGGLLQLREKSPRNNPAHKTVKKTSPDDIQINSAKRKLSRVINDDESSDDEGGDTSYNRKTICNNEDPMEISIMLESQSPSW